jgi:hypothetical protein
VTQKLEKSLACAHSWDGSVVRSGTPNFPLLEEPSLTGPTRSPLGALVCPGEHEGAPDAFRSTEYKAPPARANFGVVPPRPIPAYSVEKGQASDAEERLGLR